MSLDSPLVLIAAVSHHERRMVESCLKKTPFNTLAVDDATDAAHELAANGTSSILIIDSGLLEALHDSQWRRFRAHRPGLGAVVRCLIPRANGSQPTNGRTFLVHPDDDEGMRQAVRVLAAPPKRPD